MLNQFTIFTSAITLLLLGCGSLNPKQEGTTPVDHQPFDELLKKHVDSKGNVDYIEFKNDRELLNHYLSTLSETVPNDEFWTEQDQLAYWINAYNAFTIQLILDHYPLSSIKDIGSKIQIPFVNTPWDIKFIKIGEEMYDLNNIEHNILRKNFDEPRIHFAIVCASISCPQLRREAYVGSQLEDQLAEQAAIFLSDPNKNEIAQTEVKISKIFSWFKGDFTKNGSLIDFLNQHGTVSIQKDAKISHMKYNWGLNDNAATLE